MDTLMATVVNGKGAMPPRGTCAACSDEDLRAAVEYMLSTVE
jgi:cytochrome c5